MSCYDGFRLGAPSECSMRSKARIDALFEDSRSVCSSSVTLTGWAGTNVATPTTTTSPVLDDCCATDDDQRRVNSAVQARIEAMFASVEAESTTPGECAAAILPVKYMGAAPVGGRVASVRGLQEPLRQLVERIGSSVNAELEVSRRGLTFRTGELHEKNNPFRRIAVWSALKLQVKRRHNNSNAVNNHSQEQLLHAFVPLVADERTTINPSTNVEDRHADLYRTMRGLSRDVDDYPPIFAVVMRRPGAARLLECHAFACRCEEDAIAAAATLYRALLADLDVTSRRPRQKNGLGCVSLASVASSTRETEDGGRRTWGELRSARSVEVISESISPPAPANQPVRPPRVKKNSLSSSANTEDEQSSSTLRPNGVNVVDKAPRRKKKVSDVKAEDVLEARSRRLSLVNGSESIAVTRRNENNSSSSSSNLEQTNEERRMNAKNKIYGTRGGAQAQQMSSNEVQVIEKIYEGRVNGGKLRASDSTGSCNENGDKSSSDRERSGSYDFECCTENSLYESSRIYAKARANGKPSVKPISRLQLNPQQRMYEVSRQSPHSTSTTTSSSGRPDTYTPRPPAPAPPVELTYAGQRRRSIASSVASLASNNHINNNNNNNNYSSSARRRSDHFRDADKIYSIGPEETGQRSARGEDKIYDSNRPNRLPPTMRSNYSEHSARSSGKRLSRVSTMDRPLRCPSIDATVHQLPTPQQLQQQQRRRSRAGSEPPPSHTQAAVNAASTLMKRSQSDLDIERGDLMTRVELPRRGSFLKPGSVRKRDGLEGGGAGTPLGFTELFDEFRNQEGLESVDDILAAIIDPEGMSFNDLKPLYKEFLLKLAATLTQDELYQRSASIMRRRRRPQRRRSSRSAGRPCLLRRAIKRSVSRLRSTNSAPTEFTSVLFPARRLNDRSSFASSSSGDGKNGGQSSGGAGGHHHRGNRVLASKLGRRRSTARASSGKSRLGHTTSEDSDTCRRIGRSMIAATANRSSSGYVSCSECSYDSESCTCVSADKCYCSLSRKSPPADTAVQPPIVCSCDTDSCSESNKCYCARKPLVPAPGQHPSILEQLRQKGIVPSESTLSRNGSPERNKTFRPSKSLASSKSLEYLKVRSSSIRGSTDNLALDYDLFTPGGRRSSQCSSSASEKVLVVSARDPQGRLIYVGGGDGKHHESASRHCHQGSSRHRRHVVTASSGHHEALSIKKSAEIAAVFGGHNGHPRISRRASSTSSLRSSVSLEAGLGYLP